MTDEARRSDEDVPPPDWTAGEKDAFDRAYKLKDLRIKQVAVVISTATLVGLIFTVALNTRGLANNNLAVRNSVQIGAVTLVTRLDRFFFENDDLYPYFFEGRASSGEPKLKLAAEYVLDVLDLMKSQGTLYSGQWSSPETWGPWVSDLFKTSPVLRQFLQDHPCWYGKEIYEVMKKGTPGVPDRPPCETT